MLLIALLILAGAFIVFGIPTVKRASIGPVIDANFADPCILQINQTWYAFSGPNDHPKLHVQIARSTDFSNWTLLYGKEVLPQVGAWTRPNPHVWAPDVSQLPNGKFVMYYSALTASARGKHCVGAAISDDPEGPYTPQDNPLFCDLDAGGAIDANGFVDPRTNLRYIVYKVDGNSIGHGGACSNSVSPIASTPLRLQQVKSDDGYSFIGNSSVILWNDESDGANIEAPALTYDKSSGTYFLFYNSHCFATRDYNIRYATSKNLTGPYVKHTDPFLKTGSTAAKVFSPGGIDFTPDGKRAVLHGDTNMGWFRKDGSPRVRALYTLNVTLEHGKMKAGKLY